MQCGYKMFSKVQRRANVQDCASESTLCVCTVSEIGSTHTVERSGRQVKEGPRGNYCFSPNARSWHNFTSPSMVSRAVHSKAVSFNFLRSAVDQSVVYSSVPECTVHGRAVSFRPECSVH